MNAAARAWSAAAVGLAGTIVGVAAAEPMLATALAGVGLAAVLAGQRLRGGLAVELATLAGSLAAGWGVAVVATPAGAGWYSGRLTLAACFLAVAAVLFASSRHLLARPAGGYGVTALVNGVAVLLASTILIGPIFHVLGALFVVAQVAAMRAADATPLRWRELPPRRCRLLAASVGVAAATTLAAALSLPPAYDWASRRLGLELMGSQTGFSTVLELGDLDGMLESDELVLRVYGPRPDYLRGAVYSRYSRGRWLRGHGEPARPVATRRLAGARAPDQVEIIAARRAEARFFTPLDMRAMAVPDRVAHADFTGVISAAVGLDADRIRFELGPRDSLAPAGPVDEDLLVPEPLVEPLSALARRWASGEDGPEAQARALVRHLRGGFSYSLESRTPRGVDPVVAFLERGSGHCEYFASALALLARTLGIPARVVAGYRVAELNPIGGHHVVRERDAHAWVEAYFAGRGWVTLDATPPSPATDPGRDRTPWAFALLDELAGSTARAWLWLTDREPGELLGGAGVLLVLWLAIRWLARLRARGRGAPRGERGLDYRPPRTSVVRLLDELARLGEPRADSETLERLATRLARSPTLRPDAGESAADLLVRYAALRYGDRGEPAEIDAGVERWLARFARRR